MLSTRQVAEKAGVSRSTVTIYAREGRLPYKKIGPQLFVYNNDAPEIVKEIFAEGMGKAKAGLTRAREARIAKTKPIDFTPVKPPEEKQKPTDPEVLADGKLIKTVLKDIDDRLMRIELAQDELRARAMESHIYNKNQWATVSTHLAANTNVALEFKDAIAELKQMWA
jgi:AcrR family transcriptional regulator